MAASINNVLPSSTQKEILDSKVLVVGAGGIGCEVLKNLVLCGFPYIEVIDLDTIDLSNLNRQFLFHRCHVGKSKAQVARESALMFNPNVTIVAHHDSIMSTDYGVNFFQKFNIVLNALDNRAARNHVNRMSLNADVPLIESGTAGYNGQVELIKRGMTQCYECTPKATQKTFPGCTIRNTPSEPIHCIVWAKHLFNQLFGESADDEDISPDIADPEAQGNQDTHNGGHKENGGGDDKGNPAQSNETGNIVRISTRQWAKDVKYDPEILFNKFFYDDINYLLSMSNLWKTRKPPSPVKWDKVVPKDVDDIYLDANYSNTYHKIWQMEECAAVFSKCLKELQEKLGSEENEYLVWDKDDKPAMDFVAACANIRANIFGIPRKSRFNVKSMAGNIIPAIATTNAITAGMVVIHALKILKGQYNKCQSVYVRSGQNPRQQVIVPEKLFEKPNPNCYVCSADPAINVRIDTNRMLIKEFRDEVLIKALNMVNPDVIVDARGIVVISSEEGETECNENKTLHEMQIVDGVLLKCDDFFQQYELSINVIHFDSKRNDAPFEVLTTADSLNEKTEAEPRKSNETKSDSSMGPSTSFASSRSKIVEVPNDDDDLVLIEDDETVMKSSAKRKTTAEEIIESDDSDDGPTNTKRLRATSIY